jgi:putative membrane protein
LCFALGTIARVDEREVKEMLAHAAWWPGFGLLWIVLFWGFAVFFFRRRRGWWGAPRASGEAVLGERYARGEITEDEYRERLRVLKDR